MKDVLHPYHLTAWSLRTQGFPLVFYNAQGEEVARARSQKREAYFRVPDDAAVAVLFYRTNSGHRQLRAYDLSTGRMALWREEEQPAWVQDLLKRLEAETLRAEAIEVELRRAPEEDSIV